VIELDATPWSSFELRPGDDEEKVLISMGT
jgi:hypothetical protein